MRLHSSHSESMRRNAMLIALLAIGAALALPFSVIIDMRGMAGYLPLHMLFETIAIVVSILIFAVGWHAYNRNLPGNLVLLACAFFGVGLLDFAHMLSYAGMPDFVTPSSPEKAIDFWLVARSLAAIALLAAVIMPWRPFASAATRYALFAATIAITAFAYWLILFHQDQLPHTFIPGQGLTAFKIVSECANTALNLAAAFMLWRRMRKPQPFNAAALFGAACVMALNGVFFTLYAGVADIFNLTGHVYKVIAYLFLYRAIFAEAIESPYLQLNESQAQLQATLDTIPDSLFELDLDGRYHAFHSTRTDLLASSTENLMEKTIADVLPPEAANIFMSALQEAWGNGQSYGKVVELPLAQGKCWFELSVSRKPVPAGREPRFIVLSREITERKRADDLAHQYGGLLQGSFNEIYLFDAHSLHFLLTSEGAENNLGYTSDELNHLTPLDLRPSFTPESFERLVAPLRSREQQLLHFETYHRRKDGTTYPVEVRLQLMHGEFPVFMAIIQDTTQRKENEAKIERLSQAYRLLSRVNEAIVRARDNDSLFRAVCGAAIESGLFRFAWVGMLDETWVIPVAHAGVEEGYLSGKFGILLDDERTGNGPTGRAIRHGTHVACQDIEHDPSMLPWREAAMKRGYQSSAAFPIREADRVVGSISVYAAEPDFFTADIIQLMLELTADISFALDTFAERRRRESAEGEIRQLNLELERRVAERTHQLEMVNRELEAFCYSVSHDLRTPLRSIDGFSQILLKKHRDQLDAVGSDYLERVRRASQHMGHLIDDLLQLSQVARGPLRRERIDLSAIAEEVAGELHKAHPERNVQITVQQGLSAHADRGLLRIVLNNLLGNAWKYTGRKARAEIEFCAHDSDGVHVFCVRDNGAGFDMEYAHKLFGAFQRLHGANEFEGTGIGLATVQRIIHRHHGKLWAEAKEGQGAAFYFTLPQQKRKT